MHDEHPVWATPHQPPQPYMQQSYVPQQQQQQQQQPQQPSAYAAPPSYSAQQQPVAPPYTPEPGSLTATNVPPSIAELNAAQARAAEAPSTLPPTIQPEGYTAPATSNSNQYLQMGASSYQF
jgi:hypothetical protein